LTLGPYSFLISLLCKFFHSILLFATFITLGACTQAFIALNKAKAMGAKARGFFSLQAMGHNHGFFYIQEEI
jgi:hypothetical protein